MVNLVAQKAAEDPDLVGTHELAQWLREKDRAPETLLKGVAVNDAIEAAGSNLDEVETVVLPFVKKFGKSAVEVCGKANEYWKVREDTGYSHEQLVTEHQKLARAVGQMKDALTKGNSTLQSLEAKIVTVGSRLEHVVHLESIKIVLDRIGKTPRQAATIIEKCEKVLDRGLTVDVLDRISIEVERLGAKVADVPRTIAELLGRDGSLQAAVDQKEKRMGVLGRAEKRLQRSIGFLADKKRLLAEQCRELNGSLRGLRSDYNALGARTKAREKASAERIATSERVSMDGIRSREEAAKTDREAKQRGQDQDLAARRQSFQVEMQDTEKGYQRKFDAMDQRYQNVEGNHQERISFLEGVERGLENRIAELRATAEQQKTVNESNRAVFGFLWRNQPATLGDLVRTSGPRGANPQVPLSEGARKIILEGMLGVMVEDARFWPEGLGRYLSNRQRALASVLREVWTKKLTLDFDVAELETMRAKLAEGVEHDYPLWKVLESDPACLARFLSNRDEDYLVRAFSRLTIPGMMRVSESITRADEVRDGYMERRIDAILQKKIDDFGRSLCGQMDDFTRQWPVFGRVETRGSSTAPALHYGPMLRKQAAQDMTQTVALPAAFNPSPSLASAAPKASSSVAVKAGEQVRKEQLQTDGQQPMLRTTAARFSEEELLRILSEAKRGEQVAGGGSSAKDADGGRKYSYKATFGVVSVGEAR